MDLQVKNLGFAYKKDRQVLQDVSFSVGQGEILGILGTNGTGKTTLLKCVNSILRPQAGSICFGERDILQLQQTEIAKIIAYVPQYINSASPVTVLDFVLQGRLPYAGFSFSAQDKQLVLQILQQLELEAYAFRPLNEMSGGERQRVLVARAMAQQPQIIILDEPTSSLDLYNQLFILKLIRQTAQKQQLAVLMTIHDLNLAAMFCDKLMFLAAGRVFAYGPANTVLTESNVQAIYNVKTCITDADGYRHVRLLKN